MQHQLIPADKWPAVEKALLQTFKILAPEDITLLTGGMSTALVYKIIIRQQPYLLRIVMQVDELNDPKRQYDCMQLAADAGIAPRVYYTNVADALSITGFISAPPIWENFTDRNSLLQTLGQKIKEIHALPLFPKLVNFLDGVDIFIQQFQALNMFPEEVLAPYFKQYKRIPSYYIREDTDIVSSHNDLNPSNILFDGQKVWILDWEAAFENDRYVDLAITAQFFAATEEQEDILLTAYFGDTLDEEKRARFFLMQQVTYMYYAMIMLRLAASSQPAGTVHNADMNTPSLQEVRAMIRSRELELATYEGKLLYSKALLNTILKNRQRTELFLDTFFPSWW
jgi:thiamine kinase-like enzyme